MKTFATAGEPCDAVGVIGVTPLDFSSEEAENIRKSIDGDVLLYGWDGELSNIKRAGRVKKNYVASASGLRAAKFIEKKFGVPYEVHVYSAHRTPDEAKDFTVNAEANGFGAIIALAGMAAHLAGVVAGHTTLPVIGIPMKSKALEGIDALLATVQMPSGIPVATVAIDGAKNAALLAIQMLALSDDGLAEKLEAAKAEMIEGVKAKDAALQEKLAAL